MGIEGVPFEITSDQRYTVFREWRKTCIYVTLHIGGFPVCVQSADHRPQFRSRHTPLHTVKAVILGQDPYHNHNQAHGLCFSVRPPTQPPPSLVNIYKALKNDYPSFNPPPKPNSGLLTPWAERGVLMLNTCLTVRAHEANSHKDRGWERFTQKIIDVVAKVSFSYPSSPLTNPPRIPLTHI